VTLVETVVIWFFVKNVNIDSKRRKIVCMWWK